MIPHDDTQPLAVLNLPPLCVNLCLCAGDTLKRVGETLAQVTLPLSALRHDAHLLALLGHRLSCQPLTGRSLDFAAQALDLAEALEELAAHSHDWEQHAEALDAWALACETCFGWRGDLFPSARD